MFTIYTKKVNSNFPYTNIPLALYEIKNKSKTSL